MSVNVLMTEYLAGSWFEYRCSVAYNLNKITSSEPWKAQPDAYHLPEFPTQLFSERLHMVRAAFYLHSKSLFKIC